MVTEWDGSKELVAARLLDEEMPGYVEITYINGMCIHNVGEEYFWTELRPTTINMPEPIDFPHYN
jgi:hypothetical protein